MRKSIFDAVKKIIPRVSDTELIALRSGTTSLDREIFKGNVKYPREKQIRYEFPSSKIDELLSKYGKYQEIYPNAPYKKIFDYVGKNKFLSFIIDRKYGGIKLSVKELSSVLTKISSVNPALGIAVMVPNSLGPAELLQHYGTEEQKEHYLPGLANGDYIPCFGLTGPTNGSDATGTIDEGTVKLDEFGRKYVDVVVNKRYITLAPVANLFGLAIKVKDPHNLLNGGKGKEGVTVFLLKKRHGGLEQETHHNPLNVGFPNGTIKGHLKISLDDVIGGKENTGHGWKMLMECLAAGRGICLPATAKASSNVATLGMYHYASHRVQFKMPIIQMEGIQKKIVDMLFHTWLINSSVALTNNLLDSGEKPAVISAIMKQQTTDRARDVLNHAMDIHAGSAICLGENNFLEKFYKAAPIGITVEGSNTLTKNLIIFGQGLNKSHPHISDILENILNDDVTSFNKNFYSILKHSLERYIVSFASSFKIKSLSNCYDILEEQTSHFANLANFIALKGGAIKSQQMLSADMADILSNLYLAHSVVWFHKQNKVSKDLTFYCINRLCQENQHIINRVVDNQPLQFKILLSHMKKREKYDVYKDTSKIILELQNNQAIRNVLQEDIIIKNTPIEKLMKLDTIRNTDTYDEEYQKVIGVGEFSNHESNLNNNSLKHQAEWGNGVEYISDNVKFMNN
jgi:acyl-CoA dehydrogenase